MPMPKAVSQVVGLTVLDSGFRNDGDGGLLRLGLHAHALGIAWEFDPYFGLSVSRVDPLPQRPRRRVWTSGVGARSS